MNILLHNAKKLADGWAGFRRSAAIALCFVLPFSAAVAQQGSGSLGGRVTDNGTQANLAGAIVSVLGTQLETAADRGGEFFLPNVPAGPQTIRVSYLGLDTKEFPVTIVPGARATLAAGLGAELFIMEEFVVSSQRTGQAAALNQQRASESLRTIVSADATGRFPDRNAGESVSRISGVSLQRDQGEGRFITVRGVDPDLNNTKINGVVIPASESDTRKVNLDTISADLIESIEIQKAVTPDMDADAIGGSVNVTTTNGFSKPGRTLRGSVEGSYNDYFGDWGHKYAVTVADQFGGGNWAYLVSYNYGIRSFGTVQHEMGGWELQDGLWTPSDDFDAREYDISRERSGLNLSLDYRPSADDAFYVRGVYNHFSDTENRYRTLFKPENVTSTSDHTGSAVGEIEVDLKDRTEDTSVSTLQFGGEHQRGSTAIDYQVAYAYADVDTPLSREPVFTSADSDIAWDYDYSDPNRPVYRGDALNYSLSDILFSEEERDIGSKASEYEISAQANVKHDFGFLGNESYVKTGVKYRAKTKRADANVLAVEYGSDLPVSEFARDSVKGQAFRWTINPLLWEKFWRGATFDVDDDKTTILSNSEDYTSEEDVIAAYLMGSTKIDKLQVITGVRVEQTSFSTTGNNVDDSSGSVIVTRQNASRDYTNVMPSVVLRYDFSKNLIARASWTNTLARPKFTDAAFITVREDDEITYGNPALDPYEAVNWDASIEYYPKSLGVVSLGVYRKEIKNFVYDSITNAGSLEITRKANGDTAVIQGIEADWQMQFTMLPEPFDGLAFSVNATISDSEADYGTLPHQQNLPFLFHSDKIANVAISYEKYGFFIRIAAKYLSANPEELGVGPEQNRSHDLINQDHFQIDASTSYKINKNLTVFVEGTNLNDQPMERRWNVSNGLGAAAYYGWTANVGIKFDY